MSVPCSRFAFTPSRLRDFADAATDRRTAWDTTTLGLAFIVHPGGLRVFSLRYRDRAGRQRWLKLGNAATLTLAEARRLARDRMAAVHLGHDPAAERDTLRAELTVADLAERYLREYVAKRNAASAKPGIRGVVRRHIVPGLGHLKLSELTRARVHAWHASMGSVPIQANRALAALSKMCSLATVQWELAGLSENPCKGIERNAEQPRVRHFEADELRRIGKAIDDFERSGEISPWAAAAVRLYALTGLRRSELLKARWDWVDVEQCLLHLAATKTGPRSVPLSTDVLAIFATLPRLGPFVFPGRDPAKPANAIVVVRAWTKIRRAAELGPDATLHVFRSTAATTAARRGMNAFTMRDLFGWRTLAMPNRYAKRIPHHLHPHAEEVARVVGESMGISPIAAVSKKGAA
ncbi:site-specific integrase [Roseomonas sp. CAU 1739]|uniref:tyrosine-type recombinase/integrase n=1 Tax=Roseomonas sp. CAU 1739 TaxID=3140364 RepID=UPI00325B7228